MKSKFCSVCKEVKPVEEFNKYTKGKDSLQHYCRVCSNRKRKEWDLEDPERTKGKHLRDTYGISLADYNKMLSSQNHKCAICGKDEVKFHKRLVVDHDHSTGKIRALLCNTCNHGLGNFKDDITSLASATQYLIKHSNERQ